MPGTLDTPDHIYRNLTDAYPAIDQADALVMQWVCNSAYDAGIMPTEIQSFTIKGELR
ncbi:MAG TPA: hypothetical protein VFT74_07270 [Isosphaeraceae bacterium]|nr:hypothetical protein [Isosphaeraceae bacterium]